MLPVLERAYGMVEKLMGMFHIDQRNISGVILWKDVLYLVMAHSFGTYTKFSGGKKC